MAEGGAAGVYGIVDAAAAGHVVWLGGTRDNGVIHMGLVITACNLECITFITDGIRSIRGCPYLNITSQQPVLEP